MDIGKFGKLKGDKHPRDLRKIDPVSERSTPKAKPKRKGDKPYGYEYTVKFPWDGQTEIRQLWFASERSRDQSMKKHNKDRIDWWSEAIAISRGTNNGS
jgi:hypothetical protein